MNAIAQRHCPTLRRAADGTVAGLVTGALGLLLGIFLGARIGDVVFGGPFAGAVVGAVAGIGLGATAAAIVIRDGSYMHGATTGVVCGLAGRSAIAVIPLAIKSERRRDRALVRNNGRGLT